MHYLQKERNIKDERNCHANCKKCNEFDGGNLDVYKQFLLNKYGSYVINELKKISRSAFKLSDKDAQEAIDYYKEETKLLKKQKGL